MTQESLVNCKFVTKAGLMLLGCLVAVYGGCVINKKSATSMQWTSTTGVVLSGKVISEKHYMGRGSTSTCFRPVVYYEYDTPRGKFQNHNITYGGAPCTGRALAEKTVARYPPGSNLEVFYNHENPLESCLRPSRTNDGTVLIFLGGFGFLAFIIYVGGRVLDRYFGMGIFAGTTGYSGRASADPPPYTFRETITSPLAGYLWISIIMLLFAWFVLPVALRVLFFPQKSALDEPLAYLLYLLTHPPYLFLLPLLGLTVFIIFVTNRVSIRLEGGTLHLPPRSRYQRRVINVEHIVSTEERLYDYAPWALLLPGKLLGTYDCNIVPLIGYKGPGVVLRYYAEKDSMGRLKSVLTGADIIDKNKITVVHFPCRRAAELCQMLQPTNRGV